MEDVSAQVDESSPVTVSEGENLDEVADKNIDQLVGLLSARLQLQHGAWDSLDNKALGFFTVGLTVFGLYLAALTVTDGALRSWEAVAVSHVALGFAITSGLSWRLYRLAEAFFGPNPKAMMDQLAEPTARKLWAETLEECISKTEPQLIVKRRLLNQMQLAVLYLVAVASAATIWDLTS